MANFPTLTINPEVPLNENQEDPTIRSKFEGGYELTRPRFTRIRKAWTIKYRLLPAADKVLLDTFFNATVLGGADAFNWTNPITSVVYVVRFTEPPVFKNVMFGAVQYYDVDIKLQEV